MDLQARVSRKRFSASSIDDVTILTSSNFQRLFGLDRLHLVHQEFTIRRERDVEMRKRARRRSLNLRPITFEFTAVTRTGDHVRVGFPLSNAAQMSAHRRNGVEAFLGPHNINLLV